MSTTKRIAKNFSWLLTGNGTAGVLNTLIVIYIARVLGASAYGQLQFAMAFMIYLVLIVDSGLSILGTREIVLKKNQAGAISTNIMCLRVIIAFIVYLISAALLYILPLSSGTRFLFLAVFLMVLYRALNADWIFQGLEKMEYMGIARALFSALSFLLIYFTVKGPSELIYVPLIQCFSGFLITVVFLVLLYRRLIKFELSDIKPYQWPSIYFIALPLAASTILTLIYDNIDKIMLGLMTQPSIVGYYDAAYRIYYVLCGIFSIWILTAIPIATKKIGENPIMAKVFLDKFFKLTMLFFIPVTILVFLTASLIVNAAFGKEYLLSIIALQVLIWAVIPMAITNIYGALILIPAGHFKQFFWVVAAGAGVNILLNLALIPQISYIGSAAATVAANGLASLMAFYFSRKIVRLKLIDSLISPLRISISAIVVFGLVFWVFRFSGINIQLIFGGFAFIVTALAMLLISENKFIFSFAREIMGQK